MTKEVLTLALEALKLSDTVFYPQTKIAIAAIERALAQPEQGEPVAWLEPEWGEKICPEVGYEVTITDDHPRDLCWIPLFPNPQQRTWVGLTDEDDIGWEEGGNLKDLVKAIESKLKEKNNV